jgi:outer membrane protein OmpA-like peptidoglycan-associated protein
VFQVARNGTGVVPGARSKLSSTTRTLDTIEKGLTPVRIMVDGRYAKVYVNEQRVANAPNAEFVRGRIVQLRNSYFADAANPMFIAGIRIAAGGRDLYDALSREGRAATRGILFATGSADIRPESTPTLKTIGGMLVAHPNLRLVIEGHTDNVGDDGANLALSGRRAAAVKAFLVAEFAIDAARLETAGVGEARPAADNGTAEGREQNRRVELVRTGG